MIKRIQKNLKLYCIFFLLNLHDINKNLFIKLLTFMENTKIN